jgi:hypothetical protein
MAGKRDQQKARIEKFMATLDRLKESGVIFSSTILKRDVSRIITEFFDGKPLMKLDETIGIKEKIDEVFLTSLRKGAPIFISLSVQVPAPVLRRLEQIFEEGGIDEAVPEGRTKVKPAEGWYAIVWLDSTTIKDTDSAFPIKNLFGYKLTL